MADIVGSLRLLGGGTIKNARMERLSVDPVAPLDGQIWYNTTELKYKGFDGNEIFTFATGGNAALLQAEVDTIETAVGLNADGTLVAYTGSNYLASAASVRAALLALDTQAKADADALAAEVTRATAAEGVLTTNLAAEVTRATAAEQTLTTDLAAEVTRATAAEGVLTTNLAAEVTRATAAEQTLTDALAAEVARATAAEAAEATARADADTAEIAARNAAIAAEATLRSDADAAETAARIAADAAEVTARDAAIAVETAARIAADAALQSQVNALGSAFNYVGTLEGGAAEGTPYDMATLPAGGKDSGDYYKVVVAGWFKMGAANAFFANQNDGLVFNTTGGVDKIDNTNSTVAGTESFIAVSGTADTGYTVDVDGAFKTRVSTLETGLAAEVTARTDADTAEAAARAAADTAEATARADADTVLTTNLAAEVTRATAAEGVLTTNLAAEVTRATAAEGVLTTNLAAEVTRATAAEAALQSELDLTQASAGLNADGTLAAFSGANYISAATSLRAAVAALDTQAKANADAIVAEAARATAAEGVLTTAVANSNTRLDSCFFLYTGATAATSHTVTHNIGQKYVTATVVDSTDNVIIPDSITFTDNNSLVVGFATAITCKVIVAGAKQV